MENHNILQIKISKIEKHIFNSSLFSKNEWFNYKKNINIYELDFILGLLELEKKKKKTEKMKKEKKEISNYILERFFIPHNSNNNQINKDKKELKKFFDSIF